MNETFDTDKRIEMDIPFLSGDADDHSSTDLTEKLEETRTKLSDVAEKHENAREVVQEHESRLRTLRAQDEIGEDVADEIADLEEKLENAREKRSDRRERRETLKETINILEERIEKTRAQEVQAEYDRICEEAEEKVREAAKHLSRAAEIQSEVRADIYEAYRLAYHYDADDHHALDRAGGPQRTWMVFDPVEPTNLVSADEPNALENRPRGQSAFENWLDTVASRIDGIEKPDVVQEASAATKFD